jgi:hypothetical protein
MENEKGEKLSPKKEKGEKDSSDGKFDMEQLLVSLQQCVQEDGSIHIDSYIEAYE